MRDAGRPADARGTGGETVRMVDGTAAPGRCDGGRSADTDMQLTTFEEFRELAQRGTLVPVYKEIMAGLLTPVSAFLKIAEHSDYAFLLESVEGGEQVARYSFLGK